MGKPLKNYTLPKENSQGQFGAIRRYDIHTGIDLYCNQFDDVFTIESGEVVNVCHFTGPQVGLDWWNNTDAVLIEGKSGVILYGELEPCVKVGDLVNEGQKIGKILRVLKKDKGLPMDMRHLELYEHGYRGDGEIWKLNESKPKSLRDPSNIILNTSYVIRHNGVEYDLTITKIDDEFSYTVVGAGIEVDGDFFKTHIDAVKNAVLFICDSDDTERLYRDFKSIMREINLSEILSDDEI